MFLAAHGDGRHGRTTIICDCIGKSRLKFRANYPLSGTVISLIVWLVFSDISDDDNDAGNGISLHDCSRPECSSSQPTSKPSSALGAKAGPRLHG